MAINWRAVWDALLGRKKPAPPAPPSHAPLPVPVPVPVPTVPATGQPAGSVASLPAYVWDAAQIVIAGVDRGWPALDPEAVCAEAVAAGCTAIGIEMVDHDQFVSNPGAAREPFAAYVREARARKLVVFVCIINDWIDWGEANRTGAAEKLLRIVMDQGAEGMIVQAVGETHTGTGGVFQEYALALLHGRGFKTCYNGLGGRPGERGECDYFAWHAPETGNVGPHGCLWITDHGRLIERYGFPQSPAKVREDADRIRKAGGRGFGLYGYWGMGDHGSKPPVLSQMVPAAWRELGKAWGRAVSAAPAVTPPVVAPAVDGDECPAYTSVFNLGKSGHPWDPRKATVELALRSAKRQGGLIIYDHDPIPWAPKAMDGGGWQSYAGCMVCWVSGTTLYSGWFDHFASRDRRDRGTKNWGNGYLAMTPPAGVQLYTFMVNNSGAHRSRIVRIT